LGVVVAFGSGEAGVVTVVVILGQILGDVVIFGIEFGNGAAHTRSDTQKSSADTSSVMPTK